MLDPQARALLDLIEQRGIPPTHTLSPADARRYYRERRAATQPEPPPIGEARELQAPGPHGPIPLRMLRPVGVSKDAVLPALVFFHGGGWVIGDLDTHDTLCRQLANGAGCAVLAVDYRMGPEHRFPAAAEDCIAALNWVVREATALGLDASRIAVGGDSAGGNLAAVVALAARDAGAPALAYQLLIYPATDMRAVAPSHARNGQGYLLTADTIAWFHDHYIDDRRHDLDWRASPLLHPDLKGLPPALVLTAGYDPLRDEGLQYAQRLSEAGNRVSYVCFERQIHGFILMGKVIDEANDAVGCCAAALMRAFDNAVNKA
ncbi:alpha/beta hydrolase [Noviherbaspirillum pedocola]|uniref:Alpha/beta hydrolase n=1 Tax=Noviherbaspirillum pedocola TaxID=2801341 RepID=A0A934W737_9BURK|nr:alpha/beta hydrolase [Noviherbaspirillum pedocola]MBK4736947.1 alpha/beta hydrolase [Noviherbaspirillum pedocola]